MKFEARWALLYPSSIFASWRWKKSTIMTVALQERQFTTPRFSLGLRTILAFRPSPGRIPEANKKNVRVAMNSMHAAAYKIGRPEQAGMLRQTQPCLQPMGRRKK